MDGEGGWMDGDEEWMGDGKKRRDEKSAINASYDASCIHPAWWMDADARHLRVGVSAG